MTARPRLAACILALLPAAAVPVPGQEEGAEPALDLRVSREGWGNAEPEDLEAVLRSAAEALRRQVPGRRFPAISVSRSKDGPIALYERGPGGEVRVRLDVEGPQWAQAAYQFAHEFAHVLCGSREGENPNLWLEEALCETASLFALGWMAETWKTRPPYPNWKSYAEALRKYRDRRIGAARLPEGRTLETWFERAEPELRAEKTMRANSDLVAVALLPLFESSPEAWGAVQALNAPGDRSCRTFREHLEEWRRAAPARHRDFIRRVAREFGVPLD